MPHSEFVSPDPAPWLLRAALKALERTLFRRDLSNIRTDRPIFIVGLPGSGTSVLYDLLCEHEHSAYVTSSMDHFPEAILASEWLRTAFDLRGEFFLRTHSEPANLWRKWLAQGGFST